MLEMGNLLVAIKGEALPMALVLSGDVVTLDSEQPPFKGGSVYVDDRGLIEAVTRGGVPAPTGYDHAPRIATQGVLYPGLIDLHNHLAYNFRSLWTPPRTEPYTSRDQWPREDSYKTEIRLPANAIGLAAGKAMLKYAEVKALVGGVTSIQGSAKMSHPYEGWLVRNVEDETFGSGEKSVYQSVRTLDGDQFVDARKHMTDGSSFIYHLAEGTAPALLKEFDDLDDNKCLLKRLIAIHATALAEPQFSRWGRHAGSIVWSPFSNLWLYHATTDVVAAHEAGLRVCLGADWAPSGSKNLLGELKVADLWNSKHFGKAFSQQQLCEMVTTNPADALGWSSKIGRIKAGLFADIIVVTDRHQDRYRNMVSATEREIILAMVAGRPLYGTTKLMRAAGGRVAESISVAGLSRRVRLVDESLPDADMTWREVVAALKAVREDPVGAHHRSLEVSRGEEPLRLIPDMPDDDLPLTRAGEMLAEVKIPPLDTLAPDAQFFRHLESAPILGGLLDDLRDYYAS